MGTFTDTITASGAGSWICPGGVTEVIVECWGGGGGGGSGSSSAYKGGGGGGGGAYSKKTMAVSPGSSYDYAVGAAGTAGTNNNDNAGTGGDTWFASTETVLAKGGGGGEYGRWSALGGAGGDAASGVGDTKYSGGAGADGDSATGGGGGGSGGTAANGNAGSGTSGGTAVTGGGPGGAGSSSGVGYAPTSGPGGGGGGGDDSLADGGAGWAGQLRLTYVVPAGEAPVITEPANLYAATPGTTINLTAEGESVASGDVYYRWTYSKDGGADVSIGDSDPVANGEPETYAWDTTGLGVGTYVLKCWLVDVYDQPSDDYGSVTIYLGYAFITAPVDESSHVSGDLTLTGKGYLSDAGQLRLQWEVDTHDPPDPESADYDLITSALVDQDEEVSVTANATHLGTWYVRARTLDTADATSAWTAVRTIYVLERLRLLPGSQVKRSLGKWANRVYCVVEQSSPLIVAVATNTTVSPTYAESPREIVIVAPPGTDLTGAQAIATAHLALRMDPSTQLKLSGLQVRLVDGMKLARGQRVGIVIERDGIDATLPIIELTYDVSAAVCEVTVGNWWEPKTMSDYLLAIAQKVQQLEKEAATA